MVRIPLATWKNGLWLELFDDPTGDRRPVSIIHVDDGLFARAAHQQGATLSDVAAREAFLAAFPDRLNVQRWLAGSENPGEALLPLLVLCCLAASEAADSEDNDYRRRMRDLMGWDERIINCAGLPRLWLRLARLTIERDARTPTRRLVLPDPRYRTQIGHAIELTFPSRNDARRLAQELAGEVFDLDAPRAVLGWLVPLVDRGRFSPTFKDTFNDFRAAWMNAERALADHRFWSGWQLATQGFRATVAADYFEIVTDEWGGRHLIEPASEAAMDLERALKARSFPLALETAATRDHVIPLVESEWGKLRWIGNDRGQAPGALLIRQRAFGSRVAALRCLPVSGADGWGLTFDVAGALGERGGMLDRDRLLDVMPTGCIRVDGGVLARPALPFVVKTTGHVSAISLEGDAADQLTLAKIGTGVWRITPNQPLECEVRVIAEPRGGGAKLDRALRLRRSSLAPSFRNAVPDRLFDADPAPRHGWPFVAEPCDALPDLAADSALDAAPALLDLMEYLAIRTAPIPLGALVDVTRQVIGAEVINPWDVVQSLRDAGVVRILDVRGWRGRVILSRAPRGALIRVGGVWALVFEGCVNETWIARLGASAARHGASLERRSGVSRWSPPTFVARTPDVNSLREIARAIDTPVDHLNDGLEPLSSLLVGASIATAPAGASRRVIRLAGQHAPISFLDPSRSNASPLWAVDAGGATRHWKFRDDAILDAYASIKARPFTTSDARVFARDARLPSHVARWMRLAGGVAAGPTGEDYAYAWNTAIARELMRVAPGFFGTATVDNDIDCSPISRRWRVRAVGSALGPQVTSVWNAARGARGGE